MNITNINIDFPFILTAIVLLCGFISLLDLVFLARRRAARGQLNSGIIVDYARSFFPVLLLVLLIRSFVVQPYRVPTGSLEPTVLPGDFIVVNQFAYGLRLPVLNTKILSVGEPKIGDIALFRWPKNPSIVYVKRVIGTPGDRVIYRNKQLLVNGEKMAQEDLGMDLDQEYNIAYPVKVMQEKLPTVTHKIFIRPNTNAYEDFDIVVPQHHYFMLGDNRDNSGDSRVWGFVPEENLVGKALATWMSWDSNKSNIRWERIGKVIQ